MGKKSRKCKNKSSKTIGHVACDQNDVPAECDEQVSQKPVSSQYSATDLLNKADEFINVFQYDLARKFCQRALQVEPDSIRALETYGFLELQDGNLEGAKQCFGRAIELQPEPGHSKYMYMGQMSTGQDAIQFFLTGISIMKHVLTSKDSAQAEVTAAETGSVPSISESLKPVMLRDLSSAVTQRGVSSDMTHRDVFSAVSSAVTQRDVSSAYCAVAEIYMTDACDEADAEEKCKESLDFAIKADPTNPEAHHILASFWLCKGDKQNAVVCMERGVSLWLPQLRNALKPEGACIENAVEICPVSYPARISCAKSLIELEKYEVASEILELLLDENDEIVEVWYLLGLLNFLQGPDFKTNARHYLNKGLELAERVCCDDAEMIGQMDQLMTELGPDESGGEASEDDGIMDGEQGAETVMDSESDSIDSDDDSPGVTQMDH